MMIKVPKVFAYITRRDNQLLVFEHLDYPEAGIQVPAGTLHDGEAPEVGVLREAQEETSLAHLEVVRFLGSLERNMRDFGKDEIHVRHFFHLTCPDDTPDGWQHGEFEGQEPYIFNFYWVPLTDVPPLIADHAAKIETLLNLA